MKIGGVYILTKRSIMRMIAAISAAFMLLCTSAATPDDLLMATRCANAAQSLLSLRLSLENPVSRTVVPEPLYLESKALYLKARRPRGAITKPAAPPGRSYATRKNPCMGGPRTHERSSIPNWRQKDAAALLGISTRQLRSYKTRPPDSDWPGWKDPVKLKIWLNARNGGARMAQAIKNHLPLREGGVTERGMVGSRLPPRQFRQ